MLIFHIIHKWNLTDTFVIEFITVDNLCVYMWVPGWPALWLERWSQLWSPGWLAAAGEQAVGDRKPMSFLNLWERKPGAPDPDPNTRNIKILIKPPSIHYLPYSEHERFFTHMHHERYCLHLYWCRGIQPSIFEILEDAGIETILRLQLLKRANRVRYITAVHVDTVLRAHAVHL